MADQTALTIAFLEKRPVAAANTLSEMDVDDAAAHLRRAHGTVVHQTVEQVVAVVGACTLRHARGNAGLAQRMHDGFDRQGGEVRRWPIGHHWRINRLVARVVGNACVDHVDGYALHRNLRPARGQPQREHQGG